MPRKFIVSGAPIYNPFDYYQEVEADGPIAWYKFGSSTAIYDSVGNNDGIYTPNGSLFPTTRVTDNPIYLDEPNSDALRFTYSKTLMSGNREGRIPITNKIFRCPTGGSESWTIEFWFKATGQHCGISYRADALLAADWWVFRASSLYGWMSTPERNLNNTFSFLYGSPTVSDTDWVIAPLFLYTSWQHIVIRYAHSTDKIALYINGIKRDEMSLDGRVMSATPGQTVDFGLTTSAGSLMQTNCLFAQLAYYDYALPSSRIMRHFEAAP